MGWAEGDTFKEDFFERVVDVAWAKGDGVFVAGDYWGGVYCGEFKNKKDQHWSSAGATMFGEFGDIEGCSFAMIDERPVFVIVGNFVGEGPPKDDPEDPKDRGWNGGSLIMVSNDGINWRHAMHKYSLTLFVQQNGCFVTHSMWGVVWDGRAFYAQELFMHDDPDREDPPDAPQPVKERIYSSSDGESWSKISETTIYDANELGNAHKNHKSGLSQYCTQKKNKGGIPDGYQGYDKEGKVFMKPASLTGFCVQGPLYDGDIHWNSTPSSDVEIDKDGEISTQSVGMACYGVAHGNGSLWVAGGGGGSLAMTSNKGKKWEPTFGGGKEKILCVCGAKYKDVIKT